MEGKVKDRYGRPKKPNEEPIGSRKPLRSFWAEWLVSLGWTQKTLTREERLLGMAYKQDDEGLYE